jgi:hypothetical protein
VNLPPITAPRPPISYTWVASETTNVSPADDAGTQDETFTDPGEDGTAFDQAGTWGVGATKVRDGGNGTGGRSGARGNGGAARAGNRDAPSVTIGNGRSGGARAGQR